MVLSSQGDYAPASTERPVSILLVDDDEYVRRAVRSILRRVGGRIVEAGTAGEALRLAGEQPPAIAIVDVGLPDDDGYHLAALLREQAGGAIRIIILTGQLPDEDALRAAAVDALVAKPFRLQELRETVQAQLAARTGA